MKRYESLTEGYSREAKMIVPAIKDKNPVAFSAFRILAASCVVMAFLLVGIGADAAVKQKGFVSAEEAVKAFIDAIKSNNDKELTSIFGPGVKAIISSGDPVSDKERREKFIEAYDAKNSLAREGEKTVLIVGEKDWPFPIPLVQRGEQWFFDTKAGKEEILNRRIGENELDTIQTMLAIVDAEREYAMKDPEKSALIEYAQKIASDPGKKNGLYWETKEGEEPSPLGDLVAKARAEGYSAKGKKKGKPIAYHGYYYRILKAQGKNAPGGAFDYMVKGHMLGGFAVVAYPAKYGNSGVMTFLVNHDCVVYQKDLGKNTKKLAEAMKTFDPDKTWKTVKDTSMP
jgi:hypothetical protein